MSSLDVRELRKESLPEGSFPANSEADFRFHIKPEVRRGIHEHAQADVSIEICGVLVGQWARDENGPYVVVTDYIRCDNASSKLAEVTFTHESWAHINREMDTRFADSRIIGWYHSHPDFGIFLSERDCFIQEHFFSGPGQVAYVVDPVRELEGVFAWDNGKPEPLAHFWVGDSIRTVEAAHRSARTDSAPGPEADDAPAAGRGAGRTASAAAVGSPSWGMPAAMLAALAALVFGYSYARLSSNWEREMIVEGAVAHYGTFHLMRLGLEDQLADVRGRLRAISAEIDKLPAVAGEPTTQEAEAAAKQRELIKNNLTLCEGILAQVEETYGLSDPELMALARLAAEKQAQLRRLAETESKPQSPAAPRTDRAPAGATSDPATGPAGPLREAP